MKRILATILILTMLVSTPVFAAEVNDAGDHKTDVTATFVDGLEATPTVFSLDITWDDLSFTYYESSAPTWDPEALEYNGDSRDAGWDPQDKGTVTIVNSSNTDILAKFSYAKNTGFESAGMDFGAKELYIESAVDGERKTVSNTVTPNGTLPEGTEDAAIGSITIAIAKCTPVTYDVANSYQMEIQTYIAEWYRGTTEGDTKVVGTKYVYTTDLDAMNETYEEYASYVFSVGNGALTDDQQQELNEKYYAFKAAWENFLNTKVHTK